MGILSVTMCENSPKFRPVLPKLAQWLARGAAHKDIGVILAFLIGHAPSVGRVASEAAIGEKLIGALTRTSQHDKCAGWCLRIAAQPSGIDRGDRHGQVIVLTQQSDGAVLAIVTHDNAQVGLLFGRQGITYGSNTCATISFQPISSRRSMFFRSAKSRNGPLDAMGTMRSVA
jgi:hypothetical protein